VLFKQSSECKVCWERAVMEFVNFYPTFVYAVFGTHAFVVFALHRLIFSGETSTCFTADVISSVLFGCSCLSWFSVFSYTFHLAWQYFVWFWLSVTETALFLKNLHCHYLRNEDRAMVSVKLE